MEIGPQGAKPSFYIRDALCEKVPNGRAHPSFGITPTFHKKKKKNLKSQCHTKRRVGASMHACSSFGMTTQDIRDLFAYRGPITTVFVSHPFHIPPIGACIMKRD